jgi:hypothetical protein
MQKYLSSLWGTYLYIILSIQHLVYQQDLTEENFKANEFRNKEIHSCNL